MKISSSLLLVLIAACGPTAERSTPGAGKPRPKPGRGPADVVPEAALAPGACDDAPLITIEQLGRGEHAGERVAIDVVPQVEGFCTALACYGPDGHEVGPDACCNDCGGGYGVRVRDELSLTFVKLGGCGGMDCNFHCEPFGTAPTHRYRFVGTNGWTKRHENGAIYDKSTFTVEKYCRVAE